MEKWIPSWRYVPIDYNFDMGALENVTQKCLFSNNLNGSAVRLRLNNRYSANPMHITNVSLAARNRVTGKQSKWVDVTVEGNTQLEIPADTALYTDPAALTVTCEDDLLVNMYFGEKTTIRSICTTATAYGWQSSHHTGNYHETDALGFTIKSQLCPSIAAEPYPLQFVVGLCEVDVMADADSKLIALFGDSITHMSYFSDPLTELLYAKFPGKCAVVNAGIAGNRIQKPYPAVTMFPGEGHQFGRAGKDRFEEDVYDGACPDIVFIMEGVNDCSHSLVFREPEVPTSADIFAALKDVEQQAHAHGSAVYVTTITPFGAFGDDWRDAAEALRCGYNDLIRQGTVGDKWVDLDAVMRDPEDPHRTQNGMHLGDGVHPNWFGGKKMAKAVCEQLFDVL